MDDDLKEYHKILQSVVLNWKEISKQPEIMAIIDLKKNTLCEKIKSDLDEPNFYTQAKVLAFIIYFFYLSRPNAIA